MKGREIINHAVRAKMPDREQVKAGILLAEPQKQIKRPIYRFSAVAIVSALVLGLCFIFANMLINPQRGNLSEKSITSGIEWIYRTGDEVMYSDAAALTEIADHVFTGVVDNISFAIINDETGVSPTEECNPNHLILITIYDVIVLTNYKGAEQHIMRVVTQGGIKGYREEEQLSLLMEGGIVSRDGESRIFIYRALFPLEKGEAYLFVVMDLIVELDGYRNFVGILNSRQSLLDLDNPFEAVDDFSNITVRSVISEFGDVAFEEHWENWKLNNPDWEERLEHGNLRR